MTRNTEFIKWNRCDKCIYGDKEGRCLFIGDLVILPKDEITCMSGYVELGIDNEHISR